MWLQVDSGVSLVLSPLIHLCVLCASGFITFFG